MSRSLKKGPYIDERIIKKIQNLKADSDKVIKIWNRAAVITPEMVGFIFGVHNGKEHLKVKVAEEMVGYRLGEFSPTRKFIRHGGRMAREEETASRVESAKKEDKTEETEEK